MVLEMRGLFCRLIFKNSVGLIETRTIEFQLSECKSKQYMTYAAFSSAGSLVNSGLQWYFHILRCFVPILWQNSSLHVFFYMSVTKKSTPVC